MILLLALSKNMILLIFPICGFFFVVAQEYHDGLRDVLLAGLLQQLFHALEEYDAPILHEHDVGGEAIEFAEDVAGDEHQLVLLLAYLVLEDFGGERVEVCRCRSICRCAPPRSHCRSES